MGGGGGITAFVRMPTQMQNLDFQSIEMVSYAVARDSLRSMIAIGGQCRGYHSIEWIAVRCIINDGVGQIISLHPRNSWVGDDRRMRRNTTESPSSVKGKGNGMRDLLLVFVVAPAFLHCGLVPG